MLINKLLRMNTKKLNYFEDFKTLLKKLYDFISKQDTKNNLGIMELKGAIITYLKILIPDIEKRKMFSNYIHELKYEYISIFKDQDDFVYEFLNSLETRIIVYPNKINCFSFRDVSYKKISDEEMDYIEKNYTKIDNLDKNKWIAHPKYHWEMVVRKNANDYKYGRILIEREFKLYRSTTMGEFYGGGCVD